MEVSKRTRRAKKSRSAMNVISMGVIRASFRKHTLRYIHEHIVGISPMFVFTLQRFVR